MRTVGISLAFLVLGAALFAVGVWTGSSLGDDVDLDPVQEDLDTLTGQVDEIQSVLGIAAATPTPAPVVDASADDDPFIGPEDASVTVIEFGDYQ